MKKLHHHLAPYLPYKLQLWTSKPYLPNTKEEPILKGAYATLTGDLYADIENNTFGKDTFLPILRPKSDLTVTPLDRACFMEMFFDTESEEINDFYTYGTIPSYWKVNIDAEFRDWDYHTVERLFEFHFDVFGLLKKGLAIDINILKK